VSRSELVRLFVLDTIADDYEDSETIGERVVKLGSQCGMDICIPEITGAVFELVNSSLAQAYVLSPAAPPVKATVTSVGDIDKYYYWLTREGQEIQSAEIDSWPFNQDGHVRDEWHRPSS
jgi:hypothetical protein